MAPSPPQADLRPSRAATWVERLIVFVLTACLAASFQWSRAAYAREFGVWPDEPGHFLTGVALRDLLAHGAVAHPVRFIEQFYSHFPNVTLGQWPPVLYLVEAAWSFVAGVSRGAFLALAVPVTAGAATVTYAAARRAGRGAATLAACLVVLTPGVRWSLLWVGADLLIMLFGAAAAWSLARYFAHERRRDAVLYGVFVGLAALTKGNGFALTLVPALVILLSGAWRLLRKPDLWLGGLAASALCLPWYGSTLGRFSSSFQPDSGVGLARQEFMARALGIYRHEFNANFGTLGFLLAAAALVWWSVRAHRGSAGARGHLVWPATAVCGVGFHATVPLMDIDVRYVLFAFPALAVTLALVLGDLAAWAGRRGADARREPPRWVPPRWVPPRWVPTHWAPALGYAAVAGLAALRWVPVRNPAPHGIREAAQAVARDPVLHDERMLVSSASTTETSIVAELAVLDPHRPSWVVLRAGQQLAHSGWSLEGYERRFASSAAVGGWLRRAGVRTVLFDATPATTPVVTHHAQLDSALASPDWQRVGDFVSASRPAHAAEVTRVYRYVGPATHVTEEVTVNAKGTVLVVPPAPSARAEAR